ncbi:hypothetical protein HPB50_021835 [Hyalomma asiaticum]|uniref:Uncharacterized protein n=1 Tax=Hyalomma asiaticum TaxID=266040 RepID=A0ACB7TM21_HYAAI|nr:hypothetical protein HPB50_021835 [Hyalomma asiaticum]
MEASFSNELLISLVRIEPALWDQRSRVYRNADERADAWRRVALSLGLDVTDEDIVLMSESTQEMQALLDICQSEITRLGLCFNVKTTLLRLAGDCTKEGVVTPGDAKVSSGTEYKYLSVKLSALMDMYSLHEAKTREAGLRAQCILRRRRLWGCNRY